jgi:hypothetical protein
VVETDRGHRDYDAGLAELLQKVEQEQASGRRLPFPRTHKIPAEVLAADYQLVVVQPTQDANWHFVVHLPRSARIEPQVAAGIDGNKPPTTLTSIRLAQSDTTIDVIGLQLSVEVDVAGWLDEWLEQLGMRPISSRPKRTGDGVMGDIVAISSARKNVLVARYATVRFGERTFVVVLRAPLQSYRLVARDFVLAVSSLTPVGLRHDAR